jgi:hypothetical protein
MGRFGCALERTLNDHERHFHRNVLLDLRSLRTPWNLAVSRPTARTRGQTSLEFKNLTDKPENAYLKQIPNVVAVGGLPVSASHSRAVLSRDAVTMRLPSGLNAALITPSEWPVSDSPIGLPVSVFHSRAVLSPAHGIDGLERSARWVSRTAHSPLCPTSAWETGRSGLG